MVAHEMVTRGVAVRQVARQLGVDEATLRYRLQRRPDAPDGRRVRATALDEWEAVVTAVLERFGDARVVAGSPTRCETQAVHGVLVREFGFRQGRLNLISLHVRAGLGTPRRAVRYFA